MREKIKNSTYTHKKNRIMYVNRSEISHLFPEKIIPKHSMIEARTTKDLSMGISGFRKALAFY